MPVITLLNGNKKVYKSVISLVQVAEDIKIGFSKFSVGALVNDKLLSIKSIITEDSKVQILTMKDFQSITLIRYSCIQLLSYICKIKWKQAAIGIGGITKNGFYCDISLDISITNQDLLKLENMMNDMIRKKYEIIFSKISYLELKDILITQNEIYKLEYIKNNFSKNTLIPIYYHQNYLDISLGCQASNIKFCKYFKLQKISGAYWNGNKSNKMLQRIYGTAWLNKHQMMMFFKKVEILKNKDHRLINKKMKLYHMQDESPGMIFWHYNGLVIFNSLKSFIRTQLKKWEYQEVKTPIIMNQEIWKLSGHIDNFKKSMLYTTLDTIKYCIKPMNCPAHIQIFNYTLKSYRDLPIRMAEFGICHRNESSGSLHGLLRLKSFTQDDAHIFCTNSQISTEIENCILMILEVYKIFGFKKIHVNFSTRPNQRIGNEKLWDQAELSLKNALLNKNIDFVIQQGEGAFYGPKIEFVLEDCLNRLWQCGTIQLDFYLPKRFGAFYINKDNNRETPIMIHRAILGSIERFIGILLEEYSGNLPIWLSPIQVMIINVYKEHIRYVIKISEKLLQSGIRVKYDISNETVNFKVRQYIIEKIPYIIICGDKEINLNKISVRNIVKNNIQLMDINDFIKNMKNKINMYIF